MHALQFALCLLLVLTSTPTLATDLPASIEASGNVRERGPDTTLKPLSGVLVSNGRVLARTDAAGRYRLPLDAGQTLFIIKPATHSRIETSEGEPRFWRHHFPTGSPTLRYGGIEATTGENGGWDFVLTPRLSTGAQLEVLVFGDPQPRNDTQAGYFERDIIEPILRTTAPGTAADLGLTLGDVVHDDLDLLPRIKASTERLGVPWLHVPGNHDLDFDVARDEDSLLTYRRVFGPDTLAWEEPQASFILLDNVVYQPGETPDYVGGLREDQFAFLEAYLATLDPRRRLVIAAHIPFFDLRKDYVGFRRADRQRLFALLRGFSQVLLLTAHGHQQQHHWHGEADGWLGSEPLHEYNVGATCGGFWGGAADADGLPDAVMADGTPNGYATLTIEDDGAYRLRWHVARERDHPGIALHAPRVLRAGSWPGVGLFANVFMGHADDRVEFRLGEGDWQPMLHVERADPRILAINLADDVAPRLTGEYRVPEARDSKHLWRAALPTDLASGEHRIEVRTYDRWRGELRASTSYRLVEVDR